VTAEDRNLADVSWTMAVSAEFREESRGGHFRLDFPQTDDGRFLGHTLLEGDHGRLVPIEVPVAASTT
jgi:L-aspartate oxidase